MTKVVDIKNGYIEFGQSYLSLTIALFKNKNQGKDFLAISSNTSGRGSTCGGYNMIIEFLSDSMAWRYRNDLLPSNEEMKPHLDNFYSDPDDMFPYFQLPRIGLVVDYMDEMSGKSVFQMKWTGERFEIVK